MTCLTSQLRQATVFELYAYPLEPMSVSAQVRPRTGTCTMFVVCNCCKFVESEHSVD